jgi:hypothetical protein
MDAFNQWLHVPPERVVIISNLIQMLHNASLLFVYSIPMASILTLTHSGFVYAWG